ncbi:MAG: ribonuclease Z [Candidatus Azobacteroides pseudotrichonymphae]|jgi:ribonuclease Z|uniref:Ribonuclease Z n=1 Tax=Azobacteroides pseudotrichonymphae genomovar. CFP2 TaxID=511995 RepID=RNZ_AZOPC|nr:ribonuclease Z [Candidatus Azobacteroides pseudotrichonymphae]B6YQ90.1 RecName: Full=Ribonuclease Z; Short=RNase Z; AltName: Full=tRNA 3 endonuclease; AltName: Full=tRNase Z [Candidatus Azobacteroides pseudotrichonymphae genomovar. CFP2]MDR0530155.1 ribonuclease Z [Bacteroidales bacterium OttesenSCG-928-I14]BAG83362.1 ribonuclease Z [Candidatus Azobacteroides pseudotrichonymphae genomovar. CFP2]GMO36816.1 MAG: ribonuclease Z [Candidatus Azobacteroides pseudotrichonymphae]
MRQFEVNILGCGSALPATRHSLSSQIVNLNGELYMIDCGEGSQLQFRAMNLKFQRLNHIFISHLHGDHCFGLLGLVSMFVLLGRTVDLCIYSHPDTKCLFQPLIKYFFKELPFQVVFHPFDPTCSGLIFEDQVLRVFTIPLKHRVPTVGFLFEEKPIYLFDNNMQRGNFVTSGSQTVSSSCLSKLASFSCRYAYCSDTVYYEEIIPLITGVDLLYHEATYSNKDLARAKETYHSSAQQASLIARAANVKKLMLGHFSARYPDETFLLKEAQKIFPNTILASERMILPII